LVRRAPAGTVIRNQSSSSRDGGQHRRDESSARQRCRIVRVDGRPYDRRDRTRTDEAGEPKLSEQAGLSVVVVTHDSALQIARSIPAIVAELRAADELIVIDNASGDGTATKVRELAPTATVIEWSENAGFGAACNAGAIAAGKELLLFLNPDAVVAPGFRDAIELPLADGRGWDAWQGLVTAGGGSAVNTWGGVVHFTGIAWAGGAGRPRSEAPSEPGEVAFASGACLAVRRERWERLGGFPAAYFLYHEDADLGLRIWLGGGRVGIEPRAVCDHDYEFEKGPEKWHYLERNRHATIVRTYPLRVAVAAAPALVVLEPVLLVLAAVGGWLPQKLRAYAATARALPRLLRERRAIREAAAAGGPLDPAAFAALLGSDLDSEFLGAASRSPLLSALLGLYWRLARALLGLRSA
jgi:GT2 family glycosyltransferase